MRGVPGITLLLAAAIAAGACTGQVDERDGIRDGEISDDPPTTQETCELFAGFGCYQGNVHAVDSCGEVGDVLDECLGDETCEVGAASCCRPPETTGETSLDDGANHYAVNADFDLSGPTRELLWEIDVIDAPDVVNTNAYSMVVFSLRIEGELVWLGLATDLPGSGDAGVTMTLEQDGAPAEASDPESVVDQSSSTQTSVRRPFAWSTGSYQLRLSRGDAEGADRDWYTLSIRATGDAAWTEIGSIAMLRPEGSEGPASIDSSYSAAIYVYGGFTEHDAVPGIAARIWTTAAEQSLDELGSRYSAYPNGEARWEGDALYMSAGPGTSRCTAEGTLYQAP